jgi:hypothetical protein
VPTAGFQCVPPPVVGTLEGVVVDADVVEAVGD